MFTEWQRRIAEIRAAQPDAIVLSDIPLLLEAGLKPLVDLVLLVYIPPEEQIHRLMARNGYGRDEALSRLASQMPIDAKLPEADIVIRNDGSRGETQRAVDALWQELQERERRRRGERLLIALPTETENRASRKDRNARFSCSRAYFAWVRLSPQALWAGRPGRTSRSRLRR